jgi:hypothetical protein
LKTISLKSSLLVLYARSKEEIANQKQSYTCIMHNATDDVYFDRKEKQIKERKQQKPSIYKSNQRITNSILFFSTPFLVQIVKPLWISNSCVVTKDNRFFDTAIFRRTDTLLIKQTWVEYSSDYVFFLLSEWNLSFKRYYS